MFRAKARIRPSQCVRDASYAARQSRPVCAGVMTRLSRNERAEGLSGRIATEDPVGKRMVGATLSTDFLGWQRCG